MRSIELPEPVDLEGLRPRELEHVMRDLDEAARRIDAMKAETVGAAERTVAYGQRRGMISSA